MGKNLSQYHFVDHKSHTNWPGIENEPLVTGQWQTTYAIAEPKAHDSDGANRQTAIITVPTVATSATVANHSVYNMNTTQCVQKPAGDKPNTNFKTAADWRRAAVKDWNQNC